MDAEDGNKNSVLLHCTYGKVVGKQVFEELQVLFYDACWCYCLSGTEAHSFEKYESRLFLMMTTTTVVMVAQEEC